MSTTAAAPAAPDKIATALQLGFLTVLHEANGYLGGYLAVNCWGRPLEFRLTSAVQPNRVQQILYGDTLETYICADLIGKTLVEKTGLAVQVVVTDREEVLDLRLKLDVPVAWLTPVSDPVARPPTISLSPAFRDGRQDSQRPSRTTRSHLRPRGAIPAHPRGHRRSEEDGGGGAFILASRERKRPGFDKASAPGRLRSRLVLSVTPRRPPASP